MMAYDTALSRCRWPGSDGDGAQGGEAALPPLAPLSGGRASGSIHWEPASVRYSDRPMPLGTRLFGMGGTALVILTLAALLLVRLYDAPPPIVPATMSVFDVAEPQAPPAPDTEIAPGPEQVQKEERSKEQAVEIPLPLVRVPSASAMIAPVAQPVADSGPPVEQTTAPVSSPQPQGSTRSDTKPTWEGQVLAALNRAKRYPRDASFRREQGVPWVRFVMDREGRVHSVRLERPSGFDALDREALALPMRAQPLPMPPDSVPGDRIELVVPVEFFM